MITRTSWTTRITAAWLCVVLLASGPVAHAQEAFPDQHKPIQTATKEELLAKLKIRKAKLDLDRARAKKQTAQIEYDKVQRLYEKKIFAIDELKKASQELTDADLSLNKAAIDLRQTRLDFLKDATLVTIVDAVKERTEDGRYLTKITLRNDSNIEKARIVMKGEPMVDNGQLASLLDVNRIIVTLYGTIRYRRQDADGSSYSSGLSKTIVGDPRQQFVPLLALGQTTTLSFELLKKNVDDVSVRLEYLGNKHDYPIFLKKKSSQDLPTIIASPFAQEGQLGAKVIYNLEMERLAASERNFVPVILNLPKDISAAFIDPMSNNARVLQFRFTPEVSKLVRQLEVSVPEKLDKKYVDSQINFYLVITHASELKKINMLHKKYRNTDIPLEEIKKIKGEWTSLSLRPRGVGIIEILITNKFMVIDQGSQANFKYTIYNAGTLTLRELTPEIDVPLDWEHELDPRMRNIIEPNEKVSFTVVASPPSDVSIGDYSLRIKCEGHSGIETIDAVEQNFTIRIKGKRNIGIMAGLVGVLAVLVLIIAVASVKISRR